MAKEINTIDSSIKLHNTETGVVSTITVEESQEVNDFRIKVKPTSSIYVSDARLNKYVTQMKAFLENPSVVNAIKTPTIISVEKDDENAIVNINNFESPALLDYGCTRVQFCTDKNFDLAVNPVEIIDKYIHNPENPGYVTIPLSELEPEINYFVRVLYGASGVESEWSFISGFTYSKPKIDRPIIENVELIYGSSYPFSTTLNITINEYLSKGDEELEYVLYKLYKMEDNGDRTLIRTIKVNKTPGNLNCYLSDSSLFPDVLEHRVNYCVTVSMYNNIREYSEESDVSYFNSKGIILLPLTNLKSYPANINIANPIFGVHDECYYLVNNQEVAVKAEDIESLHWTISKDGVNSEIYKYDVKGKMYLDLQDYILEPNTRYTVSVYYTHSVYGMSQVTSRTFTTKTFERCLDLLDKPLKVSNSVGYYGEIPYGVLMPETINYKGDFLKGEAYKPGEEVSVLNETTGEYDLYVCRENTNNPNFSFYNFFENTSEQSGKDIYKSGLPTANYLLDNLGVGQVGNRINPTTGWIKLQNVQGKLIYITKLHILDNISVNDLIKIDLWHPRRKTIRLHNKLYYVRLLIDSCYPALDTLDSKYENQNLYKESCGKDVIYYNESNVIKELLLGNLYDYTNSSLGFSDSTIKEITYVDTFPTYFQPGRSKGVIKLNHAEVSDTDDKFYSIRLVLEYIPDDSLPIYNMSKKIPGKIYSKEELNKIYRKHADTCYLGYVKTKDFLSTEDISTKLGMSNEYNLENMGWHKFYYKGLVYFLSDGTNFTSIPAGVVEDYNIFREFKSYKTIDDKSEVKLGKINYNELFYNVGCPKVLNNYRQVETIFKDNVQYNIFGDTTTLGLKLGRGTYFQETIMNIFKKSVLKNQDRFGNKGEMLVLNEFTDIEEGDSIGISKVGSDGGDATFLTSNSTELERRYVLNYQDKPNNITFTDGKNSLVDVVLVLSLCPTIDSDKIWK